MPKEINEPAYDVDHCPVPRWEQYKSYLENMAYEDFVRSASGNEKAVLLDVRTPEEHALGSINGALNLNYLSQTLADELEALDKRNVYYVFCRTGRRSIRVCMLLKNIGCRVVNLDGGIIGSS